ARSTRRCNAWRSKAGSKRSGDNPRTTVAPACTSQRPPRGSSSSRRSPTSSVCWRRSCAWRSRRELMPPDENDGQAVTTLAQAALLLAAKSIRSRVGRGDAVPPGDEGARECQSRDGAAGIALRGAAAIRQSNFTTGGESRYVEL